MAMKTLIKQQQQFSFAATLFPGSSALWICGWCGKCLKKRRWSGCTHFRFTKNARNTIVNHFGCILQAPALDIQSVHLQWKQTTRIHAYVERKCGVTWWARDWLVFAKTLRRTFSRWCEEIDFVFGFLRRAKQKHQAGFATEKVSTRFDTSDHSIQSIEEKYFVSCHSYNSCDRFFGIIEKHRKTVAEIYTPNDWINLIGNAKKNEPNFTVYNTQAADFVSSMNLQAMIVNRKKNIRHNQSELAYNPFIWI